MGDEFNINPDTLNQVRQHLANNGKVKKGGKHKPKPLTNEQKQALAESLAKFNKLHGGSNVKYGVNIGDVQPTPKYAVNVEPDSVPTPKYGVHLDLNPPPTPKYGLNCSLPDSGTNVKYGANLGK